MSQPTGPWGQPPKNNKPQSPWGGGGNQTPPEFDDLLNKASKAFKNLTPEGGGLNGKTITGLAALGLLLYALTGFYIVKPQELGVESVLGKFTTIKEPGLTYNYPTPFGRVDKPSVTNINRIEISSKTTGLDTSGHMLTGDENIVDIAFDVQWRVSRARPQDYVFNLVNREQTIRLIAESAMREVVGRKNITAILTTDQANIAAEVKTITQNVLDSYHVGVEVSLVQLQSAQPPLAVREAFLDVNAAQQDQSKLQNQAREYQNNTVPKAKGEAERMIQDAEAYKDRLITESSGEALRFSKIYDEYKKAPDVTRERLFLETQAKILSKVDKIILEQGGAVPLLNLNDLTKGASK